MDNLVAKLLAEGGELVEVLILLLVMVLSAIGSLIKNRSQANKKKNKTKGRPNAPKKQHRHPTDSPKFQRPSSKVPEILTETETEPILQQIPFPPETPEPIPVTTHPELRRSVSLETRIKTTTPDQEAPTQTVTALEKTDIFPGREQKQQAFLKQEDLQRAIILNEILGPPKALQD